MIFLKGLLAFAALVLIGCALAVGVLRLLGWLAFKLFGIEDDESN